LPWSWFEDQVQAAGAGPRAKAPRLSLSQPKRTQLKLKMGTPASNISGGTVDSESLKRQKEEMGQALDRANRAPSRGIAGVTPGPSSAAPSMRRSLSSVEPNGDISSASVNGSHLPLAPDHRTSIPPTLRQLPTPVMDGVPPGTPTPGLMMNGNRHSEHPFAPPRNVFSESDNPMERKFRDPGKGKSCLVVPSAVFLTLS
jgi:hypothetical protein